MTTRLAAWAAIAVAAAVLSPTAHASTGPTAAFAGDWVNAGAAAHAYVGGTAVVGGLVHVEVSDDDPATPVIAVDDDVADDGTWATLLDVSGLSDGALHLTASQEGAASSPATATKDTVAPPSPTAAVSPNPIRTVDDVDHTTVSGTASQDAVRVRVAVADSCGAAPVLGDGTPQSGSYTVTLSVRALCDGRLDVAVAAFDAAGNDSLPGRAAVVRDAPIPAAPYVFAPSGQISAVRGRALPIGGRADAPGLRITLSVRGASASPVVVQTTTTDQQSLFTTDVDISPLPDGYLTITATATNARGNTGPPGAGRIYKNAKPPPKISIFATPLPATTEATFRVVVHAPDGHPLANLPIAVVGQEVDGYGFGNFPHTGADGSYVQHTLVRSYLRASVYYNGGPAYGPTAVAKTIAAYAVVQVSPKLVATVLPRGPVAVHGVARPERSGRAMALYERTATGFSPLSTTKTSASGCSWFACPFSFAARGFSSGSHDLYVAYGAVPGVLDRAVARFTLRVA